MGDRRATRTSSSCERAISTSVLAAGCTISSNFMIVAPSFEIVVVVPLKTSLSMPRGPSVVRIVSTIVQQALMLLMICGLPCDVSVPSLSSRIVGCCIHHRADIEIAMRKHVGVSRIESSSEIDIKIDVEFEITYQHRTHLAIVVSLLLSHKQAIINHTHTDHNNKPTWII